MMGLLESLGNLVFWVFLVVAIWRYNILSYLPEWLVVVLVTAMGVSGIAGILSNLF
ncbi:hypothetical protein [Salmonella phage PhiSTP2]|nr:hypothetical protein [Salmonella phage PhiSTP2]